jgi:DNA-binding response OmpR family regulator/HPt (histidine-containing phosphotransfer) domain-containing protein
MKILLVEDDLATQVMLKQLLIDSHYQVTVTGDGRSALKLARDFAYNLILLDINIPKLDGISLCKILRSKQCEIPILLLTAKDEMSDRIIGLDAGADDYVIKPFNVQELLARIRALLRRGKATVDKNVAIWNRLELNLLTKEVRYDDRVVRLTPKEYGILEVLLLNPYRIYSRSMLIARLWELETPPTEGAINSHIKSIRHKLKTVGSIVDPIETIYGFGYRLRQIESSPNIEPTTSQIESASAIVNESILELWGEFKDSFREQIELLDTTIRSYVTTFPTGDPELSSTARKVAHQLAGSLGIYGFSQGSIFARQIEDLFNEDLQLTMLDLQLMMQLVVDLQAEISHDPVVGELTR